MLSNLSFEHIWGERIAFDHCAVIIHSWTFSILTQAIWMAIYPASFMFLLPGYHIRIRRYITQTPHERQWVSNRLCFVKGLFMLTANKSPRVCCPGPCVRGIHRLPINSPHTRGFPSQRTKNAEIVSMLLHTWKLGTVATAGRIEKFMIAMFVFMARSKW